MEVRHGVEDSWFTAISGSPILACRNLLSIFLKRCSDSMMAMQSIMGDFNAILYDNERQRGVACPSTTNMRAFKETMKWCKLLDVGYEEQKFTRKRGNLQVRLDRVLINKD